MVLARALLVEPLPKLATAEHSAEVHCSGGEAPETLNAWVLFWSSKSPDVTWKSRSWTGIKEPRLDVDAAASDDTE